MSKPNPSLQIAKDLAAKASPPFYVLNGDAIRSTTEDFRDSFARIFPHGLSLHYSFKTNSDPRVLKTLREAGMGAEVSTGQELALALQLGFRAQDVLFDGPGKTGQEIPLLLDQQVALHVDSLDELYFVLDMARVQRRKPRIGLRLAASKNGHLSRFGLDPSEVIQALDALDQRDVLPLGLQLHCGSNLDSLERLSASLKIHRTSVQAIFTRNPNAWLDLGGGFPARTLRKHYSPPSFTQQALALRQLLSQEDIDPNQHHLILEPGRCLVEDFGVFVTTVLSVKKRQDKSMVMLDASQSLISSSLRWHHDFIFLEDSCVPCDIYGSHCFEHDILAQDVQMPAQLKRGDLCLITGVGAYDLSYAHGWTRPRPPTLFIDKGFDQGAFHLSSLC